MVRHPGVRARVLEDRKPEDEREVGKVLAMPEGDAVRRRARWAQIATLSEKSPNENGAKAHIEEMKVAVSAIAACFKIGKTVRVEPARWGSGLVFKARRG
jgi:hypothetical protein